MSAFCSKYPGCGCKVIGKYCQSDFSIEQMQEYNKEENQKPVKSMEALINESMEEALAKTAEIKYIIPVHKEKAVKNYAASLREKYPHIKQHRLMKKIAAYFHLDTDA